MKNTTTLIIGANSYIARAIAKQVVSNKLNHLIVISRNTDFYQQSLFITSSIITVDNYLETNIQNAVSEIANEKVNNITQVFICHGILHNDNCAPEKRLEDFSTDTFTKILEANTITPMLWLKHLTPILTSAHQCKVVFFSARVGSISDNRLGGWYSYRTSKAALNMLLKTASVELARRSKNVKLISFHPGTTDTPLSKPYQKNVPKNKLFSPEFVANQLLDIVDKTEVNGQVSYLDWRGNAINW